MSQNLSSLISQISKDAVYYVYDLYDNAKLIAKLSSKDELTLKVNTSGSVRMVKVRPVFGSDHENLE